MPVWAVHNQTATQRAGSFRTFLACQMFNGVSSRDKATKWLAQLSTKKLKFQDHNDHHSAALDDDETGAYNHSHYGYY